MSRRDGAIVAWHEVPGTAPPQKSRPVGYGLIRAAMRAKFDDWSDEISFRVRRTFRREIPLELAPTGRFFRGTLSQALRARLRSVLSLQDALANISQQALISIRTK
jgi:hypothetical protein